MRLLESAMKAVGKSKSTRVGPQNPNRQRQPKRFGSVMSLIPMAIMKVLRGPDKGTG